VDTPNNKKKSTDREDGHSNALVLIFDTETTNDEYQNLKFGSCGVWANKTLMEFIVFYNEALLKEPEISILSAYANEHGYTLMSRTDFVEKVFYPYVYTSGAVCVGFNLPFDLSRLAIGFGKARKKMTGGFSFQLSTIPWLPRIAVKNLDSKRSFIKFTTPYSKSEIKVKPYKGCFIDLKTMIFALTDRSYDLKNALIDFQCTHRKIDTEEHGRITPEYVHYNVNDTRATYELYEKAIERYSLYGLDKQPNRLYSPASIGKAYLAKIGITPFMDKNPDFPKEVLGYLMAAYYGGRTEVRTREEPVNVSYLDFTSMYPSLYVLMNLDKFLKAHHITWKYNKDEVQDLINTITPEDIRDKDIWKRFPCICRVRPDDAILPVRAKYSNKHVRTIGINHLKANFGVWYALPDLIASKFLTGKTPIIEDAISFQPEGPQSGLKEVKVLDSIELSPEEDFIKKLIEERLRIKKEMKKYPVNSKEWHDLDLKQNILKIIANSTSYGIFIEINREDAEEQRVDVYGIDQFKATVKKVETPGPAFNPIMAVAITSSTRLILATAEALIAQNGGKFAYCDTDSIFVSPDQVKPLQEFFRPLNPYNVEGLEMFKVETDDEGQPLENVLFYGISAKRYTLYDYDSKTGEIKIRKHSSHGLGHLQDIDEKTVWMDILSIHYHPENKEAILKKYEGKYAVSQLTITKPDILDRFKKFNEGKLYHKRIKPFNFITVGTAYKTDMDSKDPIIPMLHYISPKSREYEQIPFTDFTDYKTGKTYSGEQGHDTRSYWKPLTQVIKDYIDHPESKSEGDIGQLKRRHITAQKTSVSYIGKESNDLDDKNTTGADDDSYTEYQNMEANVLKLLCLTPREAQKRGISKTQYYDIIKGYKAGKEIRLSDKTVKLLASICGF
jgi:hypothetical protein